MFPPPCSLRDLLRSNVFGRKAAFALALSLGGCTPSVPDGYMPLPEPIKLADCPAAEAAVEFFPAHAIGDFEATSTSVTIDGVPVTVPQYNIAQYFYSYVDGTSAVKFEGSPMDATPGYQPAATQAS